MRKQVPYRRREVEGVCGASTEIERNLCPNVRPYEWLNKFEYVS